MNMNTQSHRTFFCFIIGIAIVGLMFVALSLLRSHHTGVVTRVGHIGTATHTSGTGRRRHTRKGYSADVKVRLKDTGETVTVHYRVGKRESIPAEGDEVEVADYALTGYGPYPQKWAVEMGWIMLGIDALVFAGYLIVQRRKRPQGSTGSIFREK